VIRVTENVELLKRRMKEIDSSRDELNRDIQEQTELSRFHQSNINGLKPELKRLTKLRDQLKE